MSITIWGGLGVGNERLGHTFMAYEPLAYDDNDDVDDEIDERD